MNKKEARIRYKEVRRNVTDRSAKEVKVTELLMNWPLFQKMKKIAVYVSLPEELNTRCLLEEMLKEKEVGVPKVKQNTMEMIKIDAMSELREGNFHVLEPESDGILLPEMVLVPGIAFDKKGNRLGYGKGYYDRYLKGKKCLKVGLAFEECVAERLPAEDSDIRMDYLITPEGIYRLNGK